MKLPESRTIQANNLNLHYLDWESHGSSVLFLHGISSQAQGWADIADLLHPEYRVLALDQRGHGESEKPKTGYSPLAYAADIAAVINGLDLAPCHLVGHSLGGLTGLLCAALFPDTVEKLVIIDIGPDAGSDEALDAIVEYIQSMPTGFSSLDEAAEQIFMHVDSFFPGYNRDSARNRARYGLRQDSDERWVWKYDTDGMIQTLRELHRDWWEYLPRIQCPSLIVRGEWSMSFAPETAERMVQVIPQGRSVEIEDAGHLIPHEAPQTLAAELRTFFKKA